jgi:glycosyltransferase involved in cell wall biosynthesis
MRISYIAAGAAGMYCGSCLRDNTLATALRALGHDCLLVPTYTPLKTDEADVSHGRVFYGGVNVYLQQKSWLFRHTPWLWDRLLDARALLNWVSKRAGMTDPSELGEMTVSVLEGEHGKQRKELHKLVRFLKDETKPEIVNLPNAMFVGIARPLREALGVPVVVTVSGEDLFLEGLTEPYRSRAMAAIRKGLGDCDAVIATSRYYADEVSALFDCPRERIHVVPLGLNLKGHGGPRPETSRPPTVGFLARQCPAKGLHLLVEAFRLLRSKPGGEKARLRVAGYLGQSDEAYVAGLKGKLADWGLTDAVDWVGEVDRAGKVAFLQSVDVFSVPTVYRESKGLPVVEALANATPVVQPAHGAWPEMVEATGGGLLVKPHDPADLADGLHRLLTDPSEARRLGLRGQAAVRDRFTAAHMAEATAAVYRKFVAG